MADLRASSTSRGYGSRWRKARAVFLAAHPLCVRCAALGRIVAATVVDHVVPHRGDLKLFWDRDNWQALCAPCHDQAKQREELDGFDGAIGFDGYPLDPRHPANRTGGASDREDRPGPDRRPTQEKT